MAFSYLAGLATGFWSGQDEVQALWQEDKRWKATTSADDRTAMHATWRKAVDRTLDWAE